MRSGSCEGSYRVVRDVGAGPAYGEWDEGHTRVRRRDWAPNGVPAALARAPLSSSRRPGLASRGPASKPGWRENREVVEGGAMSSVAPSRTRPLVRASKLRVPTVPPWVVARPRLSAVQKAAERNRVVLVSAPAGYGKSTLVAQWSALDPRASGWVQLCPGDNDPVVLLAQVVAALERTGPVRDELLEELSGRTPRIDEVAIPLLAADLGEREPFVLVLDDAHVVTAEEEPRDSRVSRRGGSIRLSAGVGHARRSGGATRPAPREWGCGRDRDRAPRPGPDGDP